MRAILSRYALSMGAAAALLAGCAGTQAPFGASDAIPQGRAAATHGGSWMLPDAARQDLIYASGPFDTFILSYPDGNLITSFQTGRPASICSNDKGQVFIPEQQELLKYKHGGTSAVARLNDPGFEPSGCASDATTGDIAATNMRSFSGGPGNVAVFEPGNRKPVFYSDPSIANYYFCTYDDEGNLYVTGTSSSKPFVLAELPKGSQSFREIAVSGSFDRPGELNWDGGYLVLRTAFNNKIYRLAISGSSASIVGTTTLSAIDSKTYAFFIQRGTVLAPTGRYGNSLGFWHYPKGGRRLRPVGPLYEKHASITGLVVSVAPQR